MGAIASQITCLANVYSTVYSGADQWKYKSSLVFVRGIHRRPVNSPHKGPVTRKMFPFDDVIMVHERSIVYGNKICISHMGRRNTLDTRRTGARFNIKTVFLGMGIFIIKMDRLILPIAIPILVTWRRYRVGCRYNAAQYNVILQTPLQSLWQNVYQSTNPLKIPHTSP